MGFKRLLSDDPPFLHSADADEAQVMYRLTTQDAGGGTPRGLTEGPNRQGEASEAQGFSDAHGPIRWIGRQIVHDMDGARGNN